MSALLLLLVLASPGDPPAFEAFRTPERAPGPRVAQEVPPAPDDAGPQDAEEAWDEALRASAGQQQTIRDLLTVYRRIEGLRDVRIRMEGRVLVLEGRALSAEDRERAGELAEQITGAVYVDNGIEVERSLSGRTSPAIDRFGEKGRAFVQFLPVLVVGLALLFLTGLATWWVGHFDFPYDRLTPNVFARNILRQFVRTVVFLTGVLLTLELLGATALIGAVLGAAGLLGLAIGFAFRDIAENYLAGILLSLRQPFAPMDHVQLEGHEGKVARLTGRETILMTPDGNHVRIPNTLVFKGVLTNFSRNPRRRFQLQVGIAPDEDVGRALRIGRETLQGLPGVLEHPPVSVRAWELAASSVELRFSAWVDQGSADFGKVRSEAVRALKEALEREGVSTPPPEYGVRILGEGEPPGPAAHPGGPPPTPSPPAGTAPAAPGGSEPHEPDVAVDTTIEEQIAEDLESSKDDNLLETGEGQGKT